MFTMIPGQDESMMGWHCLISDMEITCLEQDQQFIVNSELLYSVYPNRESNPVILTTRPRAKLLIIVDTKLNLLVVGYCCYV